MSYRKNIVMCNWIGLWKTISQLFCHRFILHTSYALCLLYRYELYRKDCFGSPKGSTVEPMSPAGAPITSTPGPSSFPYKCDVSRITSSEAEITEYIFILQISQSFYVNILICNVSLICCVAEKLQNIHSKNTWCLTLHYVEDNRRYIYKNIFTTDIP